MRILLLNQYFPPDPAPTGVLLGELAERLQADGHTVDFIDAGAPYRAGQKQRGRARRELTALARMLWRGLRAARPAVVISATSPPLLLIVATLVALRHRARSIHWAMDLYPELAVALGEIRHGPLARLCATLMRWAYRRTQTVVALDEDMAAHLRERYGVTPEICRPWVFAPVIARLEEALQGPPAVATPALATPPLGASTLGTSATGTSISRLASNALPASNRGNQEIGVPHEDPSAEPWTWLYSGNLGRAHEWETLLQAQRILETRDHSIRLLFQGGGPAWPAAQARAAELGLRRCDWRGYVDEADLPASLLRSAVCVATQRPEARGLLWPSKLGLLLALPRPILWVGDTTGAIAQRLRGLPRAGVFAAGDAELIAEWLLSMSAQAEELPIPERPDEIRTRALDWWSHLINTKSGG